MSEPDEVCQGARSQMLQRIRVLQFWVFLFFGFFAVEVKEGTLRKITWRWAKAKWELDYKIINKMMCFLEGANSLFPRCVNLDAQK